MPILESLSLEPWKDGVSAVWLALESSPVPWTDPELHNVKLHFLAGNSVP